MRTTDLTGRKIDFRKKLSQRIPGLLDLVKDKINFKKGQKAMLLKFEYHGGDLTTTEIIEVTAVKMGVVMTQAGAFKSGRHCSAWDFDEKEFNGGVDYYSRPTYFLLPIRVYQKFKTFQITNLGFNDFANLHSHSNRITEENK